MSRVIYTTKEGFQEIREVPNGLSISDYDKGITIGPPDLRELGYLFKLEQDILIKLNHALVREGFIQWPDLSGQRHKLTRIVAGIVADSVLQRNLKYRILMIYQQAYVVPADEETYINA